MKYLTRLKTFIKHVKEWYHIMSIRKQVIFLGMLLPSILTGFGAFAETAPEATYPIGCWTYMDFEDQTRPVEQVVKDWQELGITHPLMPATSARTDQAAVRHMLDLCQKAGLHPIMTDARVDTRAIGTLQHTRDAEAYRCGVRAALDDWGSHPAVSGFFLHDEPPSNQTVAVCSAARVCLEEDASKIWYLNLLPWYDWIGERIGSKTYAPYLDKMAAESGLASLGYDCYAHQNQIEGSGLGIYFNNLREWMELTIRRPGFRYTVTQLCVSHQYTVIRSIDDYRWQINTAAAMGAKSIVWFFVDMSFRDQRRSENFREAPINVFGERTENYRWLSTENRIFQRQFGSEFMRLAIEGAWMTKVSHGGVKLFTRGSDADVLDVSSVEPVLVSFFHDDEGVRYLAAVNLSRKLSSQVRYVFAPDVKPLQRLFSRRYEPLRTASDPVGAHSAGAPASHSAANFLAPGQLLLVKLVKGIGTK